MPTILEHLAALFDKDMRAILNNPRAISMIANPSARVQMAAVRRDRSVICFIERPTEKVQLTAVRNAPHNIHFITSPSERVQLTVIGNRPSYIGFIPNPTEKVQLKAVEKRPECIFLLQKPAEKVQLTAVLKDPRYLSAIREPTEKVQLAAVQKNPECIRHIAEPTEKVQHMAVQRNPFSRMNDDRRTDGDGIRSYGDFFAVLPDVGNVGTDIHETRNGTTGPVYCHDLEPFANLIKKHDGNRFRVFSDAKGTNRRNTHEEMFIENPAMGDIAQCLPENVIAQDKIGGYESCQVSHTGKRVKEMKDHDDGIQDGAGGQADDAVSRIFILLTAARRCF